MKKIAKIPAIKLTFIYSLYSFIIFNIPLFNNFYEVLNPHSFKSFSFLISLAIIAFALSFIFYLIIPFKLVKIVFLIINSLTFYFIFSYNILVDDQMVANTFATDMNEVKDLLSLKMFAFVFFLGVLPSIFLLTVDVVKSSFAKRIIYIVVCILISLILLLANFVTAAGFFRVNRQFGDAFIPFNYLTPIFIISKNKIISKRKAQPEQQNPDFKIDLTSDINIVLIVGETARRKNFSLYGYGRDTNPNLAKVNDLHIIQNAISCGTSTKISIPCIFKINENYENILSTLKRSGVNIKWYENNYGGCYLMCDGIETFKTDHAKCDGSCPDGMIFEKFYEDLKATNSGVNIFVLHQNGSHGPLYYKRYPKEFSKFTPECKTPNVSDCSMEELVNAYDNSILYTDFLIAETIKKLQEKGGRSVMIYASDHGESLGENGIFLHGFPLKIAPKEQVEIPYLIWSSFPISIKPQEVYGHKTIMQSILYLMKAQSYEANQNIINQ